MTAPGAAGTARPIDYRALTEVALPGGTATLLLVKGLRGQLDYYIHPRYTLLAVASALVLLLMAGARLHAVFSERPTRGPGWVALLLALPLLLGTLVQFQATCSGISATSTVSRCAAPNLQSQICNLQSHQCRPSRLEPAPSQDAASPRRRQWWRPLAPGSSGIARIRGAGTCLSGRLRSRCTVTSLPGSRPMWSALSSTSRAWARMPSM